MKVPPRASHGFLCANQSSTSTAPGWLNRALSLGSTMSTRSSGRQSCSLHHLRFCGSAQSPAGAPLRIAGLSGSMKSQSFPPPRIHGKVEKKLAVRGGAKRRHILRRRVKRLGLAPVRSLTPRSKSASTPSKSQKTCQRVPGSRFTGRKIGRGTLKLLRLATGNSARLPCLRLGVRFLPLLRLQGYLLQLALLRQPFPLLLWCALLLLRLRRLLTIAVRC
mmetsp:Transcript_74415/g.191997  ORF Transcript_74415/g.191997 Transcript_74415/m.191997 type:complete len:220 (-) Transcript_74415:101-760(-)